MEFPSGREKCTLSLSIVTSENKSLWAQEEVPCRWSWCSQLVVLNEGNKSRSPGNLHCRTDHKSNNTPGIRPSTLTLTTPLTYRWQVWKRKQIIVCDRNVPNTVLRVLSEWDVGSSLVWSRLLIAVTFTDRSFSLSLWW